MFESPQDLLRHDYTYHISPSDDHRLPTRESFALPASEKATSRITTFFILLVLYAIHFIPLRTSFTIVIISPCICIDGGSYLATCISIWLTRDLKAVENGNASSRAQSTFPTLFLSSLLKPFILNSRDSALRLGVVPFYLPAVCV